MFTIGSVFWREKKKMKYLGTFKLVLQFNEEYPNKPPSVRFVSKMFHPNGKKFSFFNKK